LNYFCSLHQSALRKKDGARMTTNVYADDEDPHASIFRPPNDEEVFVTRETEKQKRKEAKERAKNLKIWEKNTATSAAPLHRVKDRDISPAEKDD